MEFKPFGGWDYGYPEGYMVAASWTIWALVTWGTLSIDKLEAAAVLAGSLAYTEQVTAKGPRRWGHGASWVHNVQAGYCWYHYFIKGRRDLGVALGSWAEMAGDWGAIAEEKVRGRPMYAHNAHAEGSAVGVTAAFLLDMLRKKKGGKGFPWYLKALPFVTIAYLYYEHDQKEKRYQRDYRLWEKNTQEWEDWNRQFSVS